MIVVQRPYLKNTQHKTVLEEWLQWLSTCIESISPDSNPSSTKKPKKLKTKKEV
jgi:hypothetical protein